MAGFEDLRIWQISADLIVQTYELIKKFPVAEKYGLASQLSRSVNSVGANIAESTGRFHYKDRTKFLYNARGSLIETEHHFTIANRLGYVSDKKLAEIRQRLKDLGIKLNNFINSSKNDG